MQTGGPVKTESAFQVARQLIQQKGISGLYKGLSATLMRYGHTNTKINEIISVEISIGNHAFSMCFLFS